MPERRHISDEGWRQSQKLFAGQQTTNRIEISRSRVTRLRAKLREDIASGLILGVGIPAAAIALNLTDNGPEWLQNGALVFGAIMAAGSALVYKEDEQANDDWQEILSREIANSRISIAKEDMTLTRAIYESELKFSSDDEVANIKLVLNYLRSKNLLIDQQENSEQNQQ